MSDPDSTSRRVFLRVRPPRGRDAMSDMEADDTDGGRRRIDGLRRGGGRGGGSDDNSLSCSVMTLSGPRLPENDPCRGGRGGRSSPVKRDW